MALADVTDGSRIVYNASPPVTITLAGTVAVGDLVGYSGGWKAASGTDRIWPKLVAGQRGASGDIISAYKAARISGLTTGVAGADVFLSTTAGAYTETTDGTYIKVGYTLSTTDIFVQPEGLPKVIHGTPGDEKTTSSAQYLPLGTPMEMSDGRRFPKNQAFNRCLPTKLLGILALRNS